MWSRISVFGICQSCYLHIHEVALFLYFTAMVVNIRNVIVVNVDQAFALVDFVASEGFTFDPFLEFWRTVWLYSWKNFVFFLVWDLNDKYRLVIWSHGSWFASNFLDEFNFYCPWVQLPFFLDPFCIWNVVEYDWGFDLGDSSSPVSIWRALSFPLSYQLAFS